MKKHLPKVIIDTDAGHDDALAMMLLIKSMKVDVISVTTVAGNSYIQNATRNASFILDLLEKKEIPLFSGAGKPLKRKLVTAVVHGKSGLDGVDTTKTIFELTKNAPQQIIHLIRSYPNQITILTLGPLTNIAQALILDPQLPALINKLVIMGGAINVCGNKNRVAEFNLFVDPEAADTVFKSKVKKILIPLDPCNDIMLFQSDFERLKDSDLYLPIKNMMKQFIKGIQKYEGVKGALVYDALASYYLVNPKAFNLTPMDIVIETAGKYTAGMTVAEKRATEIKHCNVDVALKIDKQVFIEDFIQILLE